jgi:hypothetical protein
MRPEDAERVAVIGRHHGRNGIGMEVAIARLRGGAAHTGSPLARLVTGGQSIAFERVHPDGFYVASVKSEGRPLYEIEVEAWDRDALPARDEARCLRLRQDRTDLPRTGRNLMRPEDADRMRLAARGLPVWAAPPRKRAMATSIPMPLRP